MGTDIICLLKPALCIYIYYLTGRAYAVTVVHTYSDNTADIQYVHSC